MPSWSRSKASSYRLRQHAEIMPEHLRSKPPSRHRRSIRRRGHGGDRQIIRNSPRRAERPNWGILLRHFKEIHAALTNAKAESLIKTLKVETVYPMAHESFADVAADLSCVIDQV